MAIVRVGGTKRRALSARCADVLFFVGMLSAAFGTLSGMALWLSMTSRMTVVHAPLKLLAFHSFAQLFLFIGGFISGFILQASPIFFRSGRDPAPLPSVTSAVALTASFVSGLLGYPNVARALAALSFICTLIALGPVMCTSSRDACGRLGLPYAVGLASLAACAATFDGSSRAGLATLWAGVAPIVFATAHCFISSTFKSPLISLRILLPLYALLFATGDVLFFGFVSETKVNAAITGSGACVSLITFAAASRLLPCRASVLYLRNPLALALVYAFSWAMIGAVLMFRPEFSDISLHALGAGWAFTLIIAVSTHIVGTITRRPPLSDTVLFVSLTGWQGLVLVRILYRFVPLPAWLYYTSVIVGTMVVILWLGGLFRAIGGVIMAKRRERARPG